MVLILTESTYTTLSTEAVGQFYRKLINVPLSWSSPNQFCWMTWKIKQFVNLTFHWLVGAKFVSASKRFWIFAKLIIILLGARSFGGLIHNCSELETDIAVSRISTFVVKQVPLYVKKGTVLKSAWQHVGDLLWKCEKFEWTTAPFDLPPEGSA